MAYESELAVLKLVSESLQVPSEPSLIDRAHRLGKFQNRKQWPIIVCFNQFKVKEAIILSASKLKGQTVSISEDYSREVVYARKRLIEYAKNTNATFRLRFDKMFIGNKCFIFYVVIRNVVCAVTDQAWISSISGYVIVIKRYHLTLPPTFRSYCVIFVIYCLNKIMFVQSLR